MKLIIFKNKIKACTLIESLVSIAIILIAVLGPLSLTLNAINITMNNKNRVIASYLGEEIVEDLRAFRDGIAIACMDLQINYDAYGDISSAFCTKNGANLSVNISYLKDAEGNIFYTNRDIAWKLFMERINNIVDKEYIYMDKNSFRYDTLDAITDDYINCYLKLNTNIGYLCGNDIYDLFKRSIKLTKNTNNSLKIEVSTRYALSYIYGIDDKYVNIIDYIYER